MYILSSNAAPLLLIHIDLFSVSLVDRKPYLFSLVVSLDSQVLVVRIWSPHVLGCSESVLV